MTSMHGKKVKKILSENKARKGVLKTIKNWCLNRKKYANRTEFGLEQSPCNKML